MTSEKSQAENKMTKSHWLTISPSLIEIDWQIFTLPHSPDLVFASFGKKSRLLAELTGEARAISILGNCDSFVKRKISVINETKRDKVLLKPKVYDQENFAEYLKLLLKI